MRVHLKFVEPLPHHRRSSDSTAALQSWLQQLCLGLAESFPATCCSKHKNQRNNLRWNVSVPQATERRKRRLHCSPASARASPWQVPCTSQRPCGEPQRNSQSPGYGLKPRLEPSVPSAPSAPSRPSRAQGPKGRVRQGRGPKGPERERQLPGPSPAPWVGSLAAAVAGAQERSRSFFETHRGAPRPQRECTRLSEKRTRRALNRPGPSRAGAIPIASGGLRAIGCCTTACGERLGSLANRAGQDRVRGAARWAE